ALSGNDGDAAGAAVDGVPADPDLACAASRRGARHRHRGGARHARPRRAAAAGLATASPGRPGLGAPVDPSFLVGLAGLLALLVLIAIRVPIAYTMILIGAIGTSIASGPAILFYQLKDLAYTQFANYDLSVLPMFILMGGLASRSGLSHDLFRA